MRPNSFFQRQSFKENRCVFFAVGGELPDVPQDPKPVDEPMTEEKIQKKITEVTPRINAIFALRNDPKHTKTYADFVRDYKKIKDTWKPALEDRAKSLQDLDGLLSATEQKVTGGTPPTLPEMPVNEAQKPQSKQEPKAEVKGVRIEMAPEAVQLVQDAVGIIMNEAKPSHFDFQADRNQIQIVGKTDGQVREDWIFTVDKKGNSYKVSFGGREMYGLNPKTPLDLVQIVLTKELPYAEKRKSYQPQKDRYVDTVRTGSISFVQEMENLTQNRLKAISDGTSQILAASGLTVEEDMNRPSVEGMTAKQVEELMNDWNFRNPQKTGYMKCKVGGTDIKWKINYDAASKKFMVDSGGKRTAVESPADVIAFLDATHGIQKKLDAIKEKKNTEAKQVNQLWKDAVAILESKNGLNPGDLQKYIQNDRLVIKDGNKTVRRYAIVKNTNYVPGRRTPVKEHTFSRTPGKPDESSEKTVYIEDKPFWFYVNGEYADGFEKPEDVASWLDVHDKYSSSDFTEVNDKKLSSHAKLFSEAKTAVESEYPVTFAVNDRAGTMSCEVGGTRFVFSIVGHKAPYDLHVDFVEKDGYKAGDIVGKFSDTTQLASLLRSRNSRLKLKSNAQVETEREEKNKKDKTLEDFRSMVEKQVRDSWNDPLYKTEIKTYGDDVGVKVSVAGDKEVVSDTYWIHAGKDDFHVDGLMARGDIDYRALAEEAEKKMTPEERKSGMYSSPVGRESSAATIREAVGKIKDSVKRDFRFQNAANEAIGRESAKESRAILTEIGISAAELTPKGALSIENKSTGGRDEYVVEKNRAGLFVIGHFSIDKNGLRANISHRSFDTPDALRVAIQKIQGITPGNAPSIQPQAGSSLSPRAESAEQVSEREQHTKLLEGAMKLLAPRNQSSFVIRNGKLLREKTVSPNGEMSGYEYSIDKKYVSIRDLKSGTTQTLGTFEDVQSLANLLANGFVYPGGGKYLYIRTKAEAAVDTKEENTLWDWAKNVLTSNGCSDLNQSNLTFKLGTGSYQIKPFMRYQDEAIFSLHRTDKNDERKGSFSSQAQLEKLLKKAKSE